MEISLACIGGHEAYELLHDGALVARRLGTQLTPFGESPPIYLCESRCGPFYFLLRRGEQDGPAAGGINYRANLYALKDLGVRAVVSWNEIRALSHNYRIGQYVVVDDLVDETLSRSLSFFENGDFGQVRQWPVFCASLRRALGTTLAEEQFEFTARGVCVCIEGARQETPAEARKYAGYGGELLSHSLAPEVFLAKELQLCYASIGYVARYAESGSSYRPFEGGRVLAEAVERQRAASAVERLPRILERLSEVLTRTPALCNCAATMTPYISSGRIGLDWRTWFHAGLPANGGAAAAAYASRAAS